ncbi:MAG TPA: HAD family hydrolase [Steroidobacteraceae bacterium]|nr:HAD family hydrolase [Steroidobacteraceae bacterium]
MSGGARRTVVLDRDGTIIVDHGYLDDPGKLEFLPGALAGLRAWRARGNRVIIVSNQSGIGRGRLTRPLVDAINERLLRMIEHGGAHIDAVYYCPHAPEDGCDCRKPATRLVEDAGRELGFDPRLTVVVGDKSSDVELGQRLGGTSLLLSADGTTSDRLPAKPDYVVASLEEAARITAQLEDGRTDGLRGAGA